MIKVPCSGGRRRECDHRHRAPEQGQIPNLHLILEPRADDLLRAVNGVLRGHCLMIGKTGRKGRSANRRCGQGMEPEGNQGARDNGRDRGGAPREWSDLS